MFPSMDGNRQTNQSINRPNNLLHNLKCFQMELNMFLKLILMKPNESPTFFHFTLLHN